MSIKQIILALILMIFSVIAAISYYIYEGWSVSVLEKAQKSTEIQSLMLVHDFSSFLRNQKKPIRTLASMPAIERVIKTNNAQHLQQANQLLDIFCTTLQAMTCYLMDKKGMTIASSNRTTEKSFVGKNYSFRPYFKQSIAGLPFTYLALGVTSKKRGVYFSHPVMTADNISQGVVVIKYSVSAIEELFRKVPGIVTITGSDGVIFATNKPAWLYKQLRRPGNTEAQTDAISDNIGIHTNQSGQIEAGNGINYLLAEQHINSLPGWQLTYLVDLTNIYAKQYDVLKRMFSSWPMLLILLLGMITLWLYYKAKQEIINRTQMEKALFAAKEQAEKASLAKSEFLSRMSHELRTPLNAILGFAQMLELDAEDFNELQKENIKEIYQGGHHLLYLINDVLELSRIEAGKLEVLMQMPELGLLVSQALAFVQVQAQMAQLKIINHFEGQNIQVYADPDRLKQVLVNLLSNAVKYNSKKGSIIIAYEHCSDDYLRLSVTDTGHGLSDNDIEKLFVPFDRLNIDHNIEGTGIGLVISRHLMSLMDGRIGVLSQKNEGCTFWIELRCKAPDDVSTNNKKV